MSIRFNGRTIADTSFLAASGQSAVGGYLLRLGIHFSVSNWPERAVRPVVTFMPALVSLQDHCGGGKHVGLAIPETTIPFTVQNHTLQSGALFDLMVTAKTIEDIERERAGQGVSFKIKLNANVAFGPNVESQQSEVVCRLSQSDWLKILADCGYRKTLLLEVAIPANDECASAESYLQAAQVSLLQGRYQDAVACCRNALERLTLQRDEAYIFDEIKKLRSKNADDMNLLHREVALRQAAVKFAALSHHSDDIAVAQTYDRRTAVMMIGITASLMNF
jgi:hypothetical protein